MNWFYLGGSGLAAILRRSNGVHSLEIFGHLKASLNEQSMAGFNLLLPQNWAHKLLKSIKVTFKLP